MLEGSSTDVSQQTENINTEWLDTVTVLYGTDLFCPAHPPSLWLKMVFMRQGGTRPIFLDETKTEKLDL